MQDFLMLGTVVSMLAMPMSAIVWVVKKLRKRPTKGARKALLMSVAFLVAFTMAGVTATERAEGNSSDESVSELETEAPVTEEEETHEVSSGAQMVLAQIAEDMAKQVAQNPSTVKMSIFSQGFYKDGHTYAVQSDFTCSNLMGVKESHTIKVIAVSNEDESKITPTEVYLDGGLIWTKED